MYLSGALLSLLKVLELLTRTSIIIILIEESGMRYLHFAYLLKTIYLIVSVYHIIIITVNGLGILLSRWQITGTHVLETFFFFVFYGTKSTNKIENEFTKFEVSLYRYPYQVNYLYYNIIIRTLQRCYASPYEDDGVRRGGVGGGLTDAEGRRARDSDWQTAAKSSRRLVL